MLSAFLSTSQSTPFPAFIGEVLNRVGADGVGVKFPMFPVNCCRLLVS